MRWEEPEFIEIKMDAEINAYQGDDWGGGSSPSAPRAEASDGGQEQPSSPPRAR